jgi:predicted permease
MREWMSRLLDWFRRDALDGKLAKQWSIPLDHFQQDVRYALRGLRRSPGFTATVVLALGLGIGANAAMFNVVDRLMFRPLAYLRDPGTVHRLYWQWRDRGTVTTSLSTYYARYLDMRKWTSSFSQFAAFSERDLAVGEGESARERRVGTVSASFFTFFDARPALGRFFTVDEDVIPRGANLAVLSYSYWQSAFGGRDVRGEPLQIGSIRATIIGVAPPGFNGVNDANPPVVYVPITTYAGSTGTSDSKTYFSKYQWGWMHVMVRRKPGVSLRQAESDASDAFRRSWQAAQADDPSYPVLEAASPHVAVSSVRPGAGPDPALEARTALWVSLVAIIVLIIACANVANLSLARALRRRRETAVRIALGVSRGRLVMQSMTESLVLSLIGGAIALLVAQWAGAVVRQMLITAQSESAPILTDWRTFAVTGALAIGSGLLVGLVQALLPVRGDLARALRGGARGGVSEGARLRASLLVIQASLSVVLLVGAALFVRSLDAVKAMPMGYDADRVLLVNRIIRGTPFNDTTQRSIRRVLLSTAQSLPEVESAAWVSSAPFVSTSNTSLYVSGIDSVARLGTFTYQATSPDYFRTMGTRIVRGRGFTLDDRAGAPSVAVVSASMARVLWPNQDAIGKCFRMRSDTVPCTTVVGIAEDMVQRDITGTQRYHYYVLIDQYTRTWGTGMLLRLRADPSLEAENVRKALQRVMPGASYVTVQPLGEIVRTAQRSWRLGATMFVAFGVLALVVAAIGLHGVIGYSVTQRMHELGVRVALGAQRLDIVRLVVGQSVRFALTGVVVGVVVALLSSRVLQPLLFHQSATDPSIYAGVGAMMLLVALVASALPAYRAARADPNAALRAE